MGIRLCGMALLLGQLSRASRGAVLRQCALAPLRGKMIAPQAFAYRAFSDIKFAKSHEWFKSDGNGEAVLGISDFAQSQLGEVVYCDLPSEGAAFGAAETICTLESVKAVGEVYAPVDCEVVAVNESLSDEPALVNSSPLED